MITIKDIQTAVAKTLTANGYTVIASEVKEGFNKPACFIEVMPVSVSIENQFTELVTNSVEISYFPSVETKEELIKNADKMKSVFCYTPLEINGRFLSINEITFEAEQSALIIYFELEFYQETQAEVKQEPLMENLNERLVTESHGTSKDSN